MALILFVLQQANKFLSAQCDFSVFFFLCAGEYLLAGLFEIQSIFIPYLKEHKA